MKKIPKIMVISVICLFLAGTVHARGGYGGGGGKYGCATGTGIGLGMKWWLNSDTVKELGLSEEQVNKIDSISTESRKESIKIRAQLQLLKLDLDNAMDNAKVDTESVQKLTNGYVDQHAAFEKHRMNTLLKIREILTRDQYLKLKTSVDKLRSDRRGKRGMGKGQGQGPKR